MFLLRPRRLARSKGGMRWWRDAPDVSENNMTITCAELHDIAYRPLPPEHTMESEEDVGTGVYVQREYFVPKARTELHPDAVPLAYSETERKALMNRLADQMRDEENQIEAARQSQNPDDSTAMSNNMVESKMNFEGGGDGEAPRIARVDFMFDKPRLDFLERVKKFLPPEHDSLAEAAAVIFGCDTVDSRQYWLKMFGGLDDRSLAQSAEAVANLKSEARELEDDPVMQDVFSEAVLAEGALPNEYVEYAPLYKQYLAYTRGQTKSPIHRSVIGNTGALKVQKELVRTRKLLDRLVDETSYVTPLTDQEKADATEYNRLLKTMRLFEAKRVDAHRQMGIAAQANPNLGPKEGAGVQNQAGGIPDRNPSPTPQV